MTQEIRIVDTGLSGARWNVAMTAALVELHANGEIADTIRFHRYRPCVLLGRNQDAVAAVDVPYCARYGIEIAHRVTGGGAVFMSPRMLAWDVVLDRNAHGGDLGTVTETVCAGVAEGLTRLGAIARFRPPNDVEIGDRKVSGSSGYTEGRAAVLQGTVLIEDEVPTMACALRVPEEALRSRVTCLHEAGTMVSGMAAVVDATAQALCAALARQGAVKPMSQGEQARCDDLLQEWTARSERVAS